MSSNQNNKRKYENNSNETNTNRDLSSQLFLGERNESNENENLSSDSSDGDSESTESALEENNSSDNDSDGNNVPFFNVDRADSWQRFLGERNASNEANENSLSDKSDNSSDTDSDSNTVISFVTTEDSFCSDRSWRSEFCLPEFNYKARRGEVWTNFGIHYDDYFRTSLIKTSRLVLIYPELQQTFFPEDSNEDFVGIDYVGVFLPPKKHPIFYDEEISDFTILDTFFPSVSGRIQSLYLPSLPHVDSLQRGKDFWTDILFQAIYVRSMYWFMSIMELEHVNINIVYHVKEKWYTILTLAARNLVSIEMLNSILSFNPNVNITNYNGDNAIHLSVQMEVTQDLPLEENDIKEEMISPWYQQQIVLRLIEVGVFCNQYNNEGYLPEDLVSESNMRQAIINSLSNARKLHNRQHAFKWCIERNVQSSSTEVSIM